MKKTKTAAAKEKINKEGKQPISSTRKQIKNKINIMQVKINSRRNQISFSLNKQKNSKKKINSPRLEHNQEKDKWPIITKTKYFKKSKTNHSQKYIKLREKTNGLHLKK